ncbi:MAG: hypothetical protein VX260_01290 [Candidatus Neomarinimicrobiota bacterium]|nr:hypothetical protein [Candidatus Neomarinimicrobiota bacterium]
MIWLPMFLLFIIFLCLFLFSIWPLFLEEIINDREDYDLLNTLERRKSILYREIQYLDNEYFIDNINVEDFNTSRAELVSEVSKIIDQINLLSSKQDI